MKRVTSAPIMVAMGAAASQHGVWRWLLGAFCLFHMVAMLFANMLPTTPFGDELRAPFEPYLTYAGLWQSWAMFETIPFGRAIHPVLVAHYPDGADVERGPMLPGLRPYRPRARLIALFLRLTSPTPDMEWFARSYLQRACGEFERATGSRPSTVRLRMDYDAMLPLSEIARTGTISSKASNLGTVVATCE